MDNTEFCLQKINQNYIADFRNCQLKPELTFMDWTFYIFTTLILVAILIALFLMIIDLVRRNTR